MDQALIEYIDYVKEHVQLHNKFAKLVEKGSEVLDPSALNTALANYNMVFGMLIAEYNRKKADEFRVEQDYQEWYDEKFSQVRRKLIEEFDSKTIKISLKEIESEIRVSYKTEYREWQEKLFVAHREVSTVQGFLDSWKKFDNILVNLSYNMRAEMKSLSLDNRLNYQKNEIGSSETKPSPLPLKKSSREKV